jgi:hypothetical protein
MSDMPTAEPRDPGALTAAELRTRAVQRLTALGEMTGGIAHDFGNILAVIESGLRLAERNADSPEQVRQFIAGARDGVDRGLNSPLSSDVCEAAGFGDAARRRQRNVAAVRAVF